MTPAKSTSKMPSAAFKAAVKRRMANRTKARPFPPRSRGTKFPAVPSKGVGRRPPMKQMPSGRLVKSPAAPGAPTRSIPSQVGGTDVSPMQQAIQRRLKSRVTARPMSGKMPTRKK